MAKTNVITFPGRGKSTAAPKLAQQTSSEYQDMRRIALMAVKTMTPRDAVMFRDALIARVNVDELWSKRSTEGYLLTREQKYPVL